MYKRVDSDLFIAGAQTEESTKNIESNEIKSLLYLGMDSPNDLCAPGGFQGLSSLFPVDQSRHIPLDPSRIDFQEITENVPFPWHRILAYKRYEEALQQLQRPTAIVCKSARRASLVHCAYKAVRENLSKEDIFQYAQTQNFSFIGMKGLETWLSSVVETLSKKNPLIFHQLFESTSSTYTYLLADSISKEAVLIDPVLETAELDHTVVEQLGLKLKFVLNTHVHADHITGSGKLKQLNRDCLSVISAASGAQADVHLKEFESIRFGSWQLTAVSTPGHTEVA